MAHGLNVRKFICDRRVVYDAAGRKIAIRRQICEAGRDKRHIAGSTSRDEEFGLPGCDVTRGIETGAKVDQRRWSLGIPSMFVCTRPPTTNRPYQRLGKQGRIG